MVSELDLKSLIDQAIEETLEKNLKKEEAYNALSKIILSLLPDCDNVYDEYGTEGIISDNINNEYRRLISWAILRILGKYGQFPEEPQNFRPKIINYLRKEVGKELESAHSIDFDQQSHIVESALSKVVPKIEQELFESAVFTNLKELSSFHELTQRSLNKKQNSMLFFTFINRKNVSTSLGRINSTVEAFYSSKELRDTYTLDSFNEAIEACDSSIEALSQMPSKYTKHLEKQVRLIKEDVNKLMKELNLSEPAKLLVELEPKKHPLHIKGKTIQIKLQISNIGSGNAFNCALELMPQDGLIIKNNSILVGTFQAKEIRSIYLEAVVNSPIEITKINVIVSWNNFDKSESVEEFCIEIESQDPTIDWQALELREPYSLDAATGENFFGREKLIKSLLSIYCKKKPGSAFLWGQKRVGKTSVAKAIEAELKNDNPLISVAYIETIRDVTAQDTINRMCSKLISLLKKDSVALSNLPETELTGTLAPLSDFLESAIAIEPNRKFIIILDEFDELPVELYKARGIADAFFQTLGKGIAAKKNVGVLLVGGERIPVIMREQGMRLNMYKSVQIDYFNRNNEWDAFIELIRQPASPIEFSMDAIEYLWESTAGNPYFLNEIASRIADLMIERHDAHVTLDEVKEGRRLTLNEVDINSFAHFWEDGLTTVDDNDFFEQRSERVRFLLSVVDAYQSLNLITKENIKKHSGTYQCTTQDVERQLRSFQERKILNSRDGEYSFRVKLFQEWLRESGYLALTSLVAKELHLVEKYENERSEVVSSTDIRDLTEKWEPYRGKPIKEDDIRDWLKQFGSNRDQMLMFKLLQNVKFYSNSMIRIKFEAAHKEVVRSIVTVIKEGQKKRSDIVVTYLGPSGSSGPTMQRLYYLTNNIYRENCVDPEKLYDFLQKNNDIAAIVFTDDFVGTGKTACGHFKALIKKYPTMVKLILDRGIKVWYVSIVGTSIGLSKVEGVFDDTLLNISYVMAVDELNDKEKAFSYSSGIWVSEEECSEAREIAESLGNRLEPRAPLGFGDNQALVVFEDNCPNNSLPILYKKSKKMSSFTPLFPRS